MSKRQDKRHANSVVRIASYENLSSTVKKGYTRPALVSCKRVNKKEDEMYNVPQVLMALYKKGAEVNELTNTVMCDYSKLRDFGKSSRGKCDFLRRQGWKVVFMTSPKKDYSESTNRR